MISNEIKYSGMAVKLMKTVARRVYDLLIECSSSLASKEGKEIVTAVEIHKAMDEAMGRALCECQQVEDSGQ